LEASEPPLLVRVCSEVDMDQVRLAPQREPRRAIDAPTDAQKVWGWLAWVEPRAIGL
jgi:hypothetical protein